MVLLWARGTFRGVIVLVLVHDTRKSRMAGFVIMVGRCVPGKVDIFFLSI